MDRTQDAMQQAKDALIYAMKVAEEENLSGALRKQIETLAGKAETLQYKLKEKAARRG